MSTNLSDNSANLQSTIEFLSEFINLFVNSNGHLFIEYLSVKLLLTDYISPRYLRAVKQNSENRKVA